MKTAAIPADGQWHELPEQPVSSIEAWGRGVEVEIKNGVGMVRVPVGVEARVEYGTPRR